MERKRFTQIEFHGKGTILARIYVDGIEVQILRVGPQRINYNFREVLLGEGMEGVLDDVRLYQRALSPSEVNVLAGIALGSSG